MRGEIVKDTGVKKCIWQKEPSLVLLRLLKRRNGGRPGLAHPSVLRSDGLVEDSTTSEESFDLGTTLHRANGLLLSLGILFQLFSSGSLHCRTVKKNHLVKPAFDEVH